MSSKSKISILNPREPERLFLHKSGSVFLKLNRARLKLVTLDPKEICWWELMAIGEIEFNESTSCKRVSESSSVTR